MSRTTESTKFSTGAAGTGAGAIRDGMQELTLVLPVIPGHEDQVREVLVNAPTEVFARMDTVHNGRIMLINDGTQVLVASVYDGTWDQYIDDFSTKNGAELHAILEHCKGWPGWQPLEPAKEWMAGHQKPAEFFYVAYGDVSVYDVQKALRVKQLFDQTLEEAQS